MPLPSDSVVVVPQTIIVCALLFCSSTGFIARFTAAATHRAASSHELHPSPSWFLRPSSCVRSSFAPPPGSLCASPPQPLIALPHHMSSTPSPSPACCSATTKSGSPP
ncbi:putative bromodomain-containing protein 4-like isoform X1 [Sesbania bispinosa]|nr:putative bromodomain-containing protein 4-like isoform X1 [Sesbania bispinosa]